MEEKENKGEKKDNNKAKLSEIYGKTLPFLYLRCIMGTKLWSVGPS